jgi:hypothetical protein
MFPALQEIEKHDAVSGVCGKRWILERIDCTQCGSWMAYEGSEMYSAGRLRESRLGL